MEDSRWSSICVGSEGFGGPGSRASTGMTVEVTREFLTFCELLPSNWDAEKMRLTPPSPRTTRVRLPLDWWMDGQSSLGLVVEIVLFAASALPQPAAADDGGGGAACCCIYCCCEGGCHCCCCCCCRCSRCWRCWW